MEKKILGKIDFAEFGTIKDYPFLMGIQLGFTFNDGGVMDGGKYTVNISKECKWDNERQRDHAIVSIFQTIDKILKDSKVNYVSELIGKPVEVTLKDNRFEDFRILTEVI